LSRRSLAEVEERLERAVLYPAIAHDGSPPSRARSVLLRLASQFKVRAERRRGEDFATALVRAIKGSRELRKRFVEELRLYREVAEQAVKDYGRLLSRAETEEAKAFFSYKLEDWELELEAVDELLRLLS